MIKRRDGKIVNNQRVYNRHRTPDRRRFLVPAPIVRQEEDCCGGSILEDVLDIAVEVAIVKAVESVFDSSSSNDVVGGGGDFAGGGASGDW